MNVQRGSMIVAIKKVARTNRGVTIVFVLKGIVEMAERMAKVALIIAHQIEGSKLS